MINCRMTGHCLVIVCFDLIENHDVNFMEIINENNNKLNQFSFNRLDFKLNISKSFVNIDFDYRFIDYLG